MLLKELFYAILFFISLVMAENPFCKTAKLPKKIVNGTLDISGCGNQRLNFGAENLSLIKLFAMLNRIENLTDADLKGAWNLVELDIRFNELQTISCRAFTDQLELILLKLNDNKIKILSSGTLDPLVKLEELTLSRNRLHFLEKDLFQCNQNLKRIDLDNNPIFAIAPNILDKIDRKFNVTVLNFACSYNNKSLQSIEAFNGHCKTCMDNYNAYFKDTKFPNDCVSKDVQNKNFQRKDVQWKDIQSKVARTNLPETNIEYTFILLIVAVLSSLIPMIILLIINFCKRLDSSDDSSSELQLYYSLNLKSSQENLNFESHPIYEKLENAGTSNFPIYAKVQKKKGASKTFSNGIYSYE